MRCVRRFLSRKLREWRLAAIEVKRAKWNLRRAQALIAISKGLKGYYAKRQRKQQLAASLRVSGAPEVQGAVATFLVDDDWPKCLSTLDDGLADSDDEDDERASRFVPTRFARNPPSVREYRSINHGDDRLLQCAFWDFVTDISRRTLEKNAKRTIRRQRQRADEAKVLVDSFVRGLRREAFDADADKDTIVEHLPDDADLWRVPAMDRSSTIRARTLYDERAKAAPPPMDRGYKLRWVWDGELCGSCGAIVPNFLRARSCRTCGARTPPRRGSTDARVQAGRAAAHTLSGVGRSTESHYVTYPRSLGEFERSARVGLAPAARPLREAVARGRRFDRRGAGRIACFECCVDRGSRKARRL